MEESENIKRTAIDRIADGNGLQMMKAAIPYMPSAIQKSFSIYVKMLEMQNILSYYNHPIHACAVPEENTSPSEMINDIRTFCTQSQCQTLDQALNLINTLKLYQEIQNMN
ncbi:MAG: hypothetical protein Q4F83_14565 [Eubacteriales bacterium]|nr:hypothetical protein [Eubacteriales bacterium]